MIMLWDINAVNSIVSLTIVFMLPVIAEGQVNLGNTRTQ